MKGYTCLFIFMLILCYVRTYDLEMLFQKAMRNIFRGKKHVHRLLVFSAFLKRPSVTFAIKERRNFFAKRFLDLICRLVERCGTEEAETGRALVYSYEQMYKSYRLFLSDNFSGKTIKYLHEEYYEEMIKIVEELRRIYLLRHSRYVTKILESLLLEVIDATNNYQRMFLEVIDNTGLIDSMPMETNESGLNSIDYADETVLRFRMPTITTIRQSKGLPKMAPITHSPHGRLLADYWQHHIMVQCPFYSVHHSFWGNKTHSGITLPSGKLFLRPPLYKFRADEEETLEQAKERPQPKDFFYAGPQGYITEEPIFPYELMQKMYGKHSNWDYYNAYKESKNTKKKGTTIKRTPDLPMYRIIYDIKDLPNEKAADFIEDNNLALNKTFPYFMPEDLHISIYEDYTEFSVSSDYNMMTSEPESGFDEISERQLEMFMNFTGISVKPKQYWHDSKESQELKRLLETTTAVKMPKASKRQLRISSGNKVSQVAKRTKKPTASIKFPTVTMRPTQISGGNGMTEDTPLDAVLKQLPICGANEAGENQLEKFYHLTGISLKPQKYREYSKESQVFKKSLETTIAVKMPRSYRRLLKKNAGVNKEFQVSKRPKTTATSVNFPTVSVMTTEISGGNEVTQASPVYTVPTTSTAQNFKKKRVNISFSETLFDAPTSKKRLGIFDIYRSFEVEYSQETTTPHLHIDIPLFNITYYKSLQTSGERNEYHRKFVVEYMKVNDELLKLHYKYSKNKTSKTDFYKYVNRMERLHIEENFNVNGTAEQLVHEMWLFNQRKKYSTTTHLTEIMNNVTEARHTL